MRGMMRKSNFHKRAFDSEGDGATYDEEELYSLDSFPVERSSSATSLCSITPFFSIFTIMNKSNKREENQKYNRTLEIL
jgi:hypothetical protein